MKWHYDVPLGLTELIPLVKGQNYCPNYHQFDSHKMTDPEEGSSEEDSPEGEDFQEEVEDFQEEVEDSQEEEDTPEEVGVPLVPDHLVEDGAHCHYPYHKDTMGS